MIEEFKFGQFDGMQAAYERDGCVIVRQVLDTALVKEIDRHIDWLIERHPELRPESLGHWLIAQDPFWVRFLSDEHLLDLAQAFVGPDIGFFAADYIAKPPRQGKGVQWHQDAHYWPLAPMEVITVWFAVSQSVRANGCVRVIPGSQRLGLQQHAQGRDEANLLNAVDPDFLDESRAVDVELGPGDVSVHHPLILHGSEPNTSEFWRRGGSIQYMPATTRITDGEWQSAFLFRGAAVADVNTELYLPRPRYVAGEHMSFKGCEAWT
jgi:ectoine hydroxylase-related dioxygenase (phytanoyl-CoA dioxygenase family)